MGAAKRETFSTRAKPAAHRTNLRSPTRPFLHGASEFRVPEFVTNLVTNRMDARRGAHSRVEVSA